MIAVSKVACHFFLDNNFHRLHIFHVRRLPQDVSTTQPPVIDVSARTTMKGAVRCDKHCELQDSVKRSKVERVLLFRSIPESMFASTSFVSLRGVSLWFHGFVFPCFNVAFVAVAHVSWWCWTCATLNVFFGSGVTCDQAAPVCIFTS